MARLAQTAGLTDMQQEILSTVRDFVDKEIIPHAQQLEHADEYPQDIVDGMKELGLFGLTIPEEYGGLGESLLTYALVVEEIARGWMSVSGIINTHFIVAYMLMPARHRGAEAALPAADGDRRDARLVLDVRARPRLRRRRDQDQGEASTATTTSINGAKMWLTNGGIVEPDRGAGQDRRGRREAVPEHDDVPGREARRLRRGRAGPARSPARSRRWATRASTPPRWCSTATGSRRRQVLGGAPGKGFAQMMDGVEVGRVNVAARACGIAIRAFELGIDYAQQRETFGKPIAEHQAIAFQLAEMATKVEAAHQMMVNAARLKDSRRAQRRRGRHGQVARLRVLRGGHRGVVPHPRRLRLLQGVRDRAALARGAVPAHRRGHRGHPEDDHQPRPAQGLQAALITFAAPIGGTVSRHSAPGPGTPRPGAPLT